MLVRLVTSSLVWASCFLLAASHLIAQSPDLILHHGKIVTVDAKFSIAEAVAIRDGRIVKVGSNRDVLALKTDRDSCRGPRWQACPSGSHRLSCPSLRRQHD